MTAEHKKRRELRVFNAWTLAIVLGWILLITNGSADGSEFQAEATKLDILMNQSLDQKMKLAITADKSPGL